METSPSARSVPFIGFSAYPADGARTREGLQGLQGEPSIHATTSVAPGSAHAVLSLIMSVFPRVASRGDPGGFQPVGPGAIQEG
jgi:hypothetical protein